MKQAAVRYKDMISKFKNAPGNQNPGCVSEEVWQQWLEFWSRPEVIAKSETARQNRLSEKAGPNTGFSRHSGGSRSAYSHSIALEKEIGCAPNALECSLRIHKRRDGTFVDPRARIITIRHCEHGEVKLQKEPITLSQMTFQGRGRGRGGRGFGGGGGYVKQETFKLFPASSISGGILKVNKKLKLSFVS